VLSCIVRAIDTKFGPGVREVLFWKFQEATKLSASDIPKKPDLFVKYMREIFGEGSRSIEKAITEEICEEFDVVVRGEPDFVRAIELARSKKLKEDLTG